MTTKFKNVLADILFLCIVFLTMIVVAEPVKYIHDHPHSKIAIFLIGLTKRYGILVPIVILMVYLSLCMFLIKQWLIVVIKFLKIGKERGQATFRDGKLP